MRWLPWAILVGVLAACFARAVTANPPPVQYQQVPTFSARFSDGDPIQREILAELKGIRKDFKAFLASQVKAEPPPASLKALITLRCAECHREGTEVAKKIGMVLLLADGTVPPLSVTERRLLKRTVEGDEMPPREYKGKSYPPLTAVEKQFLLDALFPKEGQP